jgi:hypothetical protein
VASDHPADFLINVMAAAKSYKSVTPAMARGNPRIGHDLSHELRNPVLHALHWSTHIAVEARFQKEVAFWCRFNESGEADLDKVRM